MPMSFRCKFRKHDRRTDDGTEISEPRFYDNTVTNSRLGKNAGKAVIAIADFLLYKLMHVCVRASGLDRKAIDENFNNKSAVRIIGVNNKTGESSLSRMVKCRSQTISGRGG